MPNTKTPAALRNTEEQLVLRDLLTAIRQCEQERQTAQLSGLETGWEHPATQTMWRRVLFMADRVTQNAPDQARVLPSPESGCSPSPWRRMTPEEYARDFASFPPHRAEVTMAVKGVPSAEVSVFILSANASGEGRPHAAGKDDGHGYKA